MIKNLILVLALILAVPVKSQELSLDNMLHETYINAPLEVCINNVKYYVAREWVVNGPAGFGFGFLAPKIDDRTLTFVRCSNITEDSKEK